MTKKRSPRPKHFNWWRFVFVISMPLALGATVLIYRQHQKINKSLPRPTPIMNPDQSIPPDFWSNNLLVPTNVKIIYQPTAVAPASAAPPVSTQSLREAIKVIDSLKGNQWLKTETDQRIFSYLERYGTNDNPFNFAFGPITTHQAQGHRAAAFAYNCFENLIQVDPDLARTPATLAISLYHELTHAVQCESYMAANGLTRHEQLNEEQHLLSLNILEIEELAYAAQVRIFYVLYEKNLLPQNVSTDGTNGDLSVIAQSIEAWQPLLDGRFREWYQGVIDGAPHNLNLFQVVPHQ